MLFRGLSERLRHTAGMCVLLPTTVQALPALRQRVRQEVTDALELLDDAAFPAALASELQAQYARSLTSIPDLVDVSVTAQQLAWRLRRCQVERGGDRR